MPSVRQITHEKIIQKITNFFNNYNPGEVRRILWMYAAEANTILVGNYKQNSSCIDSLHRFNNHVNCQRKTVKLDKLVLMRLHYDDAASYHSKIPGLPIAGELYFDIGSTTLNRQKWIASFPDSIVVLAKLANSFELNRDLIGDVITMMYDKYCENAICEATKQIVSDLRCLIDDFHRVGYKNSGYDQNLLE